MLNLFSGGMALPRIFLQAGLVVSLAFGGAAFAGDLSQPSRAAEGASVYFISPADKAVLSSPVKLQFGLRGMGVAPAGVVREYTGHHHLLINLEELPDLGASLPSTENILHFGRGQTEAEIELPPGEHTLQLLLG